MVAGSHHHCPFQRQQWPGVIVVVDSGLGKHGSSCESLSFLVLGSRRVAVAVGAVVAGSDVCVTHVVAVVVIQVQTGGTRALIVLAIGGAAVYSSFSS